MSDTRKETICNSGEDNNRKNLSKKKVKSKRSRCRSRRSNSVDEEERELKEKLLKNSRFKRRPNGQDVPDHPAFLKKRLVHVVPNTGSTVNSWSVQNPNSYNRLVNRLEETQSNKVPKPTGIYIEGPWSCTLCGSKGYKDNLGGLFGPYYQKVHVDNFWPPFLEKAMVVEPGQSRRSKGESKSPLKGNASKSQGYTDLWFHGDCLFWAWGLLLKGNHITGLEEHLDDYWKQVCHYCDSWGASVGCGKKGCSKVYHYSCGFANGCFFRESNLTSWCHLHVKSAPKEEDDLAVSQK